tara:strand:- start:48 stop:374 length:327 start_codon:yes stop_codon:yes gene_type:complete
MDDKEYADWFWSGSGAEVPSTWDKTQHVGAWTGKVSENDQDLFAKSETPYFFAAARPHSKPDAFQRQQKATPLSNATTLSNVAPIGVTPVDPPYLPRRLTGTQKIYST